MIILAVLALVVIGIILFAVVAKAERDHDARQPENYEPL